jgi:hypothetical protein
MLPYLSVYEFNLLFHSTGIALVNIALDIMGSAAIELRVIGIRILKVYLSGNDGKVRLSLALSGSLSLAVELTYLCLSHSWMSNSCRHSSDLAVSL